MQPNGPAREQSHNPEARPAAFEIGAYIRGLTFDGRRAAVVRLLPDGEVRTAGHLALTAADATTLAAIGAAVEQYARKELRLPTSIFVEAIGTFVIMNSIEEATSQAFEAIGLETLTGTPTKPTGAASPERTGSAGRPRRDKTLGRADTVRGKIVVVTGGAQGFGEGLVRGLIAEGALVFILDMNLTGAQQLADELNREQRQTVAVAVQVNVADEESVRAAVQAIVARAGGFDIFVSNAGVLRAGSVKEISVRDFAFVTDVNYLGFFICSKHASIVMAAQNAGAKVLYQGPMFTDIIQVNSKSGLQGSNKNGAYAGGKFGGIGLVQSFALELITDNIKVNAICPGNFFDGPLWSDPEKGLFVQYLNTGKVPGAQTIADVKRFYEEKVPMGRGCRVEDVLKALLYIVEQQYETGQAVPVTGGQNMLK